MIQNHAKLTRNELSVVALMDLIFVAVVYCIKVYDLDSVDPSVLSLPGWKNLKSDLKIKNSFQLILVSYSVEVLSSYTIPVVRCVVVTNTQLLVVMEIPFHKCTRNLWLNGLLHL